MHNENLETNKRFQWGFPFIFFIFRDTERIERFYWLNEKRKGMNYHFFVVYKII